MSLRASHRKQEAVVTIRLEQHLVDALRKRAEAHERTLSAEVRIAVKRYVAEATAA